MKSGWGFFVKEGLRFKHRQDLSENENEFQSCWIEVINDLGPNTIIGCYCRHPKKSSNSKFVEQSNSTLTKIKNRNKYIFLCGDFNYNLLNHQNDQRVGKFLNII